MSGGDYDAIGATIPGTPAVVLGRNRFIAWGATNVAADVQDLYLEKLDHTGRFAEFRGQQEPLQIIPETILVKGQAPVQILVRVSRHGPLVSDAIDAMNQASPERRGASAARTAGVSLDRARSRRHHHRRDDADERSAQLERLHGGAARVRRAIAEFRLRRRRRPHRVLRARTDSDPRRRRRDAPGGGLDWRVRMDGLGAVRRAPARLRSARAPHRHGQQPAGAAGLSLPARRRMGGAVPGAAHSRSASTADDS